MPYHSRFSIGLLCLVGYRPLGSTIWYTVGTGVNAIFMLSVASGHFLAENNYLSNNFSIPKSRDLDVGNLEIQV